MPSPVEKYQFITCIGRALVQFLENLQFPIRDSGSDARKERKKEGRKKSEIILHF